MRQECTVDVLFHARSEPLVYSYIDVLFYAGSEPLVYSYIDVLFFAGSEPLMYSYIDVLFYAGSEPLMYSFMPGVNPWCTLPTLITILCDPLGVKTANLIIF